MGLENCKDIGRDRERFKWWYKLATLPEDR